MAADNLKQLGKQLGETTETIDYSTRRVAENPPHIESLRDVVGIDPFFMEFKIYRGRSATLNIFIQDVFDENAIATETKIPIAITDTGLSVGLDGNVGAENIWYPLVYLGDLNFELGSWSVVLTYSESGTGIYDYKISFDLGEVILTPVITVGVSTITIPITESNVVSPPVRLIHDAYIYGLATSISSGGWIYYESSAIYLNGQPYTPRRSGL